MDLEESKIEERERTAARLSGALIGWERRRAHHGILLSLQVITNATEHEDHKYHRVTLALNDRQLRSLARDMARAARSRGLDLRPRGPWHRRIWRALVGG